ncbi:hypothetical protein ERJ75_000623500 [Trypanosoma vivax]|nr:hypothetical protein ERJ75_000623500 [Trypanosoma vivax]
MPDETDARSTQWWRTGWAERKARDAVYGHYAAPRGRYAELQDAVCKMLWGKGQCGVVVTVERGQLDRTVSDVDERAEETKQNAEHRAQGTRQKKVATYRAAAVAQLK